MPAPPTASEQQKNLIDTVKKLTRYLRLVIGTLVTSTLGTGVTIKFAEDTAAAATNYQVLQPYNAQNPVIGDKVLCAQIPQDDGSRSVCVLGAIGPPTGSVAITGEVRMWTTTTAPTGWLFCDGSAVSRSGATAALFAVIGTTFGTGDGSTTFNIPNMQGRGPIGVGTAPGGNTGRSLAQSGGEETHKLITSEIPSHTHSYTPPAITGSFQSGISGNVATLGADNTGPTGGDGSHNNMQPFLVLNFIIKT